MSIVLFSPLICLAFFFFLFETRKFSCAYGFSPSFAIQLLSHVRLCETDCMQHARPPCPSPCPRACSHSCPLSRWCHPTISSPVIPFSSCLQCLPASWSFQMSCLFTSGGQNLSISPSNEYSGLISFRIDWFDLLVIQGTFKSLLQYHSSKHQFFGTQPSLWPNSHFHTWLLEKYYID